MADSKAKEATPEVKKPKRAPLLELKSDEKVSQLSLVKARAAVRTRQRIRMELEAKEMKALELKIAKGEASYEDAEKISSKQ